VPVLEINPLSDPRWNSLVQSNRRSSVFHTTQWLEALWKTYGYAPTAFIVEAGKQLSGGIVFCRVQSWLTGSRLVSLPFSDHCEPLVENGEDLRILLSEIQRKSGSRLKYVEIRPRSHDLSGKADFRQHGEYSIHALDLSDTIEAIYGRLHKDSMQRKIRRAEREKLVLVQGRSEALLHQFYNLLLLTRRRHGVPPQPLAWFRNLVECFGDSLTIHVASIENRPIASILTLRHRQTLVYKYGCSDERFHNLGGMSRLFWEAILAAKQQGIPEFDLGRSGQEGFGLIRFKDNLGAERKLLRYFRWSHDVPAGRDEARRHQVLWGLLPHLPDRLFRLTGEIFYRHAG
jgi:CelD/BcsL family acetyltransferase involved in cellulose biosynthesis